MNIELRHLRSFLAVAEDLNFTKAAARLHLAQQALSIQIQQLEHELGLVLFLRTTRKVVLTRDGQYLLEKLPPVLRQLDTVLTEAKNQTQVQENLTLGFLATSLLSYTPKLLRTFASCRPNAKVTIRNIAFDDPTGGVRDRHCDAALVWLPFTVGDLSCEALFPDPRVAVLPADHRLARMERIPSAELAQEPFVWVDDMDPIARDFWTLADLRGGRPAKVGARITGFEELFAAVRAGQAVACSPASIAGSLPWTDLTTRPVDGLAPAVVALCWRESDANPLVKTLVDCAKTVAQAINNPAAESAGKS